jgi:hypothetical protein
MVHAFSAGRLVGGFRLRQDSGRFTIYPAGSGRCNEGLKSRPRQVSTGRYGLGYRGFWHVVPI